MVPGVTGVVMIGHQASCRDTKYRDMQHGPTNTHTRNIGDQYPGTLSEDTLTVSCEDLKMIRVKY